MDTCRVFIGSTNGYIVIKIVGRGTWNYARVFRNLIDDLSFKEWRECYLNLGECEYLDSTFVGIIAYALKKFKQLNRNLIIVETSKDVYETLKTMGITKFASILEKQMFEAILEEIMEISSDIKKEDASFILKAHKELEELDESNIKRFESLRSVLENKINKEN
ncbi:MAG: STAS domain-containing protein [Candidatus Hydrogenedentota bacterium]